MLLSTGRVCYGNELNYPGYLGQCTIGRVSYLGRVKQELPYPGVIYHTEPKLHTSQTLPFINHLPHPSRYLRYPDWESVTVCQYQHYPTLDIYLSLTFHSDTLPEDIPYPTNRRKNTPPYIEYLPHPRHLSLHTCTHLTLSFITYPNLHFRTLYYCQGLIKCKAETTYQIRPLRPRTETTRAETTQAETTQGRNDSGTKRPENAVVVVEQEHTCRVVHLIIWLSIFVRVQIFWTSNIFVILVFPYTHDTGAVSGTEPGD